MSSTLTSPINADIAIRLVDKKFRARFIRAWARDEVAMEVRALRKKRGLRQTELATLANTGQSAVSRTEKAEYEGWTFKSLVKIAQVLDARLRITFEPIENVMSSYRQQEEQSVCATESAGTFDAAANIESEPSGESQVNWISVDAQVPPEGRRVLCLILHRPVNADWEWSRPFFATRSDNAYIEGGESYMRPDLWMDVELPPLPESEARNRSKAVGLLNASKWAQIDKLKSEMR